MSAALRRRAIRAACILLAGSLLATGLAVACGPWLTFRAYLRRSFWQPVRHFSESLATTAPRGGGTASYAGFANNDVPKPLAELRAAYREVASSFVDDHYARNLAAAQRAAAAAMADGVLKAAQFEEARLLDAKVAMRAAIDGEKGDLAEARRKLEAFLATTPSAANASEARCWLARVLYKQGDAVGAARIYLSELDRPSPVVPAAALATSMRMVFVGHEDQFWERADAFFDNPRHALFIVNVLTNPTSQWGEPRPEDASPSHAGKILALLRARKSLFTAGADSDALAIALMRVSLFSGDLDGVLRDSNSVGAASPARKTAEFNWMVASAHYLRGEHEKAEAPLQRMLDAPGATATDRRTAAQALHAVFLKLGRRVDALHSALVEASIQDPATDFGPETRPQWCAWCDTQDLPYLLDALLTKAELEAYLQKYPNPLDRPIAVMVDRKMSAPDVVRYSLAVRHARDGRYANAAAIFASLGVPARAERMRKLASMSARVADLSSSDDRRLQARFDLAAYLADNPDRLFFNDLLWHGYQRMALSANEPDARNDRESGMTAAEHGEVVAADRRLRDEQEELWQARLRLEQVVRDAGPGPLARAAVLRTLDALVAINVDRFGRQEEIAALTRKWRAWLRTHPPAG